MIIAIIRVFSLTNVVLTDRIVGPIERTSPEYHQSRFVVLTANGPAMLFLLFHGKK